MIHDDEMRIGDFLGENQNFFIENNSPELPGLVEIGEKRGGLMNPYGIPIPQLGGFRDVPSLVSYISGIYSSITKKNPVDFVRGWVSSGMDQTLYKTISSNGNALEWYILEMLIKTRTHTRSFFQRPPRELDMQGATDLFYHNPEGLISGGRTLGIQITSIPAESDRFRQKSIQVQGVLKSLGKDTLKLFGYKRPDTMGILSINGRIGNVVKKAGNKAFCLDLGLPLDQPDRPFKKAIEQESLDIADFIRLCIHTWNNYYINRSRYENEQRDTISGRDGIYTFIWYYSIEDKQSIFSLKKGDHIISHFEIFDTPYHKS